MNKIDEIKTKVNSLISSKESCDLIQYCNQLESLLSDVIKIIYASKQSDISFLHSRGIVHNSISGIYFKNHIMASTTNDIVPAINNSASKKPNSSITVSSL